MGKITREWNNWKPVKGFVLLEILDNEEPQTVVVAGTLDKPQRGKVLLVGPDTKHDTGDDFKCPVKVGDTVVHSAFGFEDFRFKGKKYRLCPFGKILLKL